MTRFLEVWCVALSLAFIWPQVWRAVRHDTSHGISPFALLHGLVGSALWLTYGILQDDAALWFSNSSFILAQSIIISVVYRHGRLPRIVLINMVLALGAMALALTQIPARPVALIAIAISGSSVVPQLIHVIRTDNLHGISLSSYGISIVSCMSWLLYGFAVNDFMISAQNFFVIPIFVFIILKAWRWRVAHPDHVTTVHTSVTA
jgi:MtN3 and saliva related transmembrane protein